MATVMMAAALAASLLAPQERPGGLLQSPEVQYAVINARADAATREVYDDVLILDRDNISSDGGCQLITFYNSLRGRLPDGETIALRFLRCVENAPEPPPSGRCRLVYLTPDQQVFRFSESPDLPENTLDQFDCVIGSDSPALPETPQASDDGRMGAFEAGTRRPDPNETAGAPTWEYAGMVVTGVAMRTPDTAIPYPWAMVNARAPDGSRFTFAIHYLVPGQPLPPPAASCMFRGVVAAPDSADTAWLTSPIIVVSDFQCRVTSESPLPRANDYKR